MPAGVATPYPQSRLLIHRASWGVLVVPRRWSDVTPAWMTGVLRGRHPGAVVSDVRLGPIEEGTNARARVRLVYSAGEGPGTVFVKRSGRVVPRLALVALRALGTEARLAASGVILPIPHPRPYGGGVRWGRLDTVVVMDDVLASGGRPNDAVSPLSVDAVASGLEGLARLHGEFPDGSLPDALRFLHPWRLSWGWVQVSVASLGRGLRSLAALAATECLPPGLDARRLSQQFAMSARLAATGPQCLLHGDPHPGNTYTLAGDATGFLDWQLARLGHWSHDVGYFLAGALSVEDRRANERALLALYLEALGQVGGSAPGWNEAWARYRATPAFGLATWLHTLSFGQLQPQDACVATIRRFAAAYRDLETASSAVTAGDVGRGAT